MNNLKEFEYDYFGEKDIDIVLDIERQSNPFPWTIKNFQDCIEKGYYSLVLKEAKQVIGFAILSVSTEESHLLNIGLASSRRGQGLGRELLEKMIMAAEVMGSKKIFLEVRVSNIIAIDLYKASGFKEIGLRKNYYRLKDGREDAILMSKSLKKGLLSKDFFSSR
tara:strand:+ start:720 stop:1214 length:495 start_codon:yes stop_codon:yes gene_type:complete